ncbi:MAG: hypothetical protein ACRDKI_05955 [Solirubrobacterales bacterium]
MTDSLTKRPRLVIVDGGLGATVRPPQDSTISLAVIPIDTESRTAAWRFAHELARALAAQTARTGAVVFAERECLAGVARQRLSIGRRSSVTAKRVQPLFERGEVLYFLAADRERVDSVLQGQMPEVTIAVDPATVPGASAVVLVSTDPERADYVELVRAELASERKLPAYTVCADGSTHRAWLRRKPGPLRSRAWEIAAQVLFS